MLLQTNSYIVPKEKRTEHGRLMQRFRQAMLRLGCEGFEVYEQTAANWAGSESAGRFVQMMRFKDRKHQQLVQTAERTDQSAQQLIREFVELINFPYQQQQGYFATGYYHCLVGSSPIQPTGDASAQTGGEGAEADPGSENPADSNGQPEETLPPNPDESTRSELEIDDDADHIRPLPNF